MSYIKERNWLRLALVLLLGLMVAVSMIPLNAMTAHADEAQADYTTDGCTFHLWYGTEAASVALQRYNGTATRIILPDTAVAGEKSYKAGENGNWFMLYSSTFAGNTDVTMIEIPSGYDTIEAGSFNGCTSLTELTIGDSVSYLGYDDETHIGAFTGCPASVYYFNGDNISAEQITQSGIGTYANGNPMENVTVWVHQGSNAAGALDAINEKRELREEPLIIINYFEDHTWGEPVETIPATTDEAGVLEYTCTCDETSNCPSPGHQTRHVLIPKLGCVHEYGAWKNLNATQHQQVCAICGDVKKANHAWKLTSSKAATETAAGSKTYTCTVCKATKTETVSKTAYTKGATEAAVNKAITKLTNDKDPKGTTFRLLQMRVKSTAKTSITLRWTKPKGAVKFVVYGNNCNVGKKVYKYAKQTTTKKTTIKFTKISKKKMKSGTFYKFMVVALDKNNRVIATSKTVHVSTKGGKAWNYKSITVPKKVLTKAKALKKGKTLKIGATAVKDNKKNKAKAHRAVCYESSNPAIATVSAKGVIKGKKKGTCAVYAYAQNGVFKKITVKVK